MCRYDALGRLLPLTPAQPDNSRTTPPAQTFTYDGLSRVATVTTSRGKTMSYSYDALDRQTRLDYLDGHDTQSDYTGDGKLSYRDDKNSDDTVKMDDTVTFDALARIATEQPTYQSAVTLTFDANSRLASFTDPTGTSSHGYDDAGSLVRIAGPGGSCAGYSPTNPPTVASNCTIFSVDKNGARLAVIFPGNLPGSLTRTTPPAVLPGCIPPSNRAGRPRSPWTSATFFGLNAT